MQRVLRRYPEDRPVTTEQLSVHPGVGSVVVDGRARFKKVTDSLVRVQHDNVAIEDPKVKHRTWDLSMSLVYRYDRKRTDRRSLPILRTSSTAQFSKADECSQTVTFEVVPVEDVVSSDACKCLPGRPRQERVPEQPEERRLPPW